MPIHMRLPKLKGFKNRFRVEFQVVNVGQAGRAVPRGRARSASTTWSRAGAVRKGELVKVLGNGDLGGVKLDITANEFSEPRPGEDRRLPAAPVTETRDDP